MLYNHFTPLRKLSTVSSGMSQRAYAVEHEPVPLLHNAGLRPVEAVDGFSDRTQLVWA